jgi:hypothetical protein
MSQALAESSAERIHRLVAYFEESHTNWVFSRTVTKT